MNRQLVFFNESVPFIGYRIDHIQGWHERIFPNKFIPDHIQLVIEQFDAVRAEQIRRQIFQFAILERVDMVPLLVRDPCPVKIKRNFIEHIIICFLRLHEFLNRKNGRTVAQISDQRSIVPIDPGCLHSFPAIKCHLI